MKAPWTIEGIRREIAAGGLTATGACEQALDRIARASDLSAFVTVAATRALAQAATLDADPARLAALPLGGVPIAVKDNICTAGLRTTAGSRILDGFVPPADATVVSRLTAAGAVIVGKTNCDEFAMGSSTENSAFGPTLNPWARDRTPGGSSGGSAAAVAARLVPCALGSDTGGSVRQPAAMCGIVGLKPTYGRVSRLGLIAFGSSLDQIGTLTCTVADAARLLGVMAGVDPLDSTASRSPVANYLEGLDAGVAGLTIGVPRHLLASGVEADVSAAFGIALADLARLGARIIDVELPFSRYAIPVYYLVATAEASSNLARYDGVRYGWRATSGGNADLDAMYDRTRDAGLGAEVKRRIVLGTYVLSAGYRDAYYLKAQQVRTLIRQDIERALELCEAIAMPTSPVAAFHLGERTSDPLQMYLADVFTVGANLAGIPAVSVPCGFTRERLPVGLQLLGRPMDEAMLLRVGHAYEQATPWSAETPETLEDA